MIINRSYYAWGGVMVLLIADRLLKQLALNYPGKMDWGWGLVFGWFINKQGVFSLPVVNWLVAIFSWLTIVGLLLWLVRLWSKGFSLSLIGLLFLLAGGFSNAYDRLIWGGVVDYFNLLNWFSFNLADCYLIIGLGCLLGGSKQLYGR